MLGRTLRHVLERWTRAVVRRRLAVLACWAVVLAAGAWAATQLPSRLTSSFAVPGTESDRAATLLADHFDERPEGSFVVVFRVAHPSDRALRARLQRRLDEAAQALPTGHARALRAGGGILFGEVATALDFQDAKNYTDDLRRALRARPGPAAVVTGQPAVQHDLDPILSADLGRGEALAVPLALLVLLALFGLTAAVAIPFLIAACTIAGSLAVVYAVAGSLTTATYVTNLVALIGLGLAVDYSLLVVHRFREELDRGVDPDEAVVRTMATAGRAVAFSGTAVAIGLGLLLFVPVPFVRSMGVGGLLVPLLSIAAALTLQPALLSLLGRRGAAGRRTGKPVESGVWARLARSVMRRPKSILAAGTVLLLLLAAPALWLRLVPGSFAGVPSSTESARGLALLRDGVAPGAVTPTHVVVDAGAAGAARRGETGQAVNRLVDSLARDPEVLVVASGRRHPYVDPTGRYARVIVVARHEYGAPASQRLVHRLRDRLVPAARFPTSATVEAGGAPPQGVDFVETAYGAFPWLVLGVLLVTYVALLRAFRSLLLPLKAVLLNLLTVAAVYGVLVAVFQWGIGAGLLGLERTTDVEGWIPIFLFAILFGLSMDYEVFLVMRMRESWDHVADNTRAVAHGLERTGRIVTAAALIMVAAFSGFLAGRVAGLQQLGFGLALAVLLDATIVRALLVPSLMAVLGRWNWWLPAPVARLARVAPSPLAEKT